MILHHGSLPPVIGDRWGATDAEVATAQPCDVLAGPDARAADRAISIDAPVDVVFRWCCQLRAAPYSYDWIDNLGRRSPRCHPASRRCRPGSGSWRSSACTPSSATCI